jgi:hypothetical protein
MTTYSIYARRADEAPASVPEAFSWAAALFPPFYAMAHGLWIGFAAWGVTLAALVAAAPYIGGEAAFWLYILFAALIGFEAAGLRRAHLVANGWRHVAEIVAPAADLAEIEWLKRRQAA